jgi:hypothetical protein
MEQELDRRQEYRRRPKFWNNAALSFFIETFSPQKTFELPWRLSSVSSLPIIAQLTYSGGAANLEGGGIRELF